MRGISLLDAFATAIRTVPSPLPLAPFVIVIQAAVVVAVQAQPAVAVTAMSKLPPCAWNVCDVGSMEKKHPVACETVNVLPAIVSVPERAGPSLAATKKVTVPLPLPAAPEVMVVHWTVLEAVHAQPAPAVTVMGVPAPPAAPIDCDVESIEGAHGDGVGVLVGVGVGVGVPVGVGVGVGVGDTVGVGVGVAVGVGVGIGDTVGAGVGVTVGVGEIVGEGVGVAGGGPDGAACDSAKARPAIVTTPLRSPLVFD